MKDEAVDPRMEKLIALLYGELSPEEAGVLRAEIESDPALRAEWEELAGTRSLLGACEIEDHVPGFILVEPPGSLRKIGRALAPAGFLGRLMLGVRRSAAVGGWGVAVAALLILFLSTRGVRLEHRGNEWVLHTGRDVPAELARNETPSVTPRGSDATPVGTTSTIDAARLLENARASQAADLAARQTPASAGPSATAPYVTRAEMESYNEGLTRTVVAMLNDYRTRRDQEWSQVMQALYGRISDRQSSDYRDLRGRIEAVGLGMSTGQDAQPQTGGEKKHE